MARVRSVVCGWSCRCGEFESPTCGLAERVVRERGAEQYTSSGAVRVGRAGDLPLSYAQQRLWFLDQLEREEWPTTCVRAAAGRGADREALAKIFG